MLIDVCDEVVLVLCCVCGMCSGCISYQSALLC